MLKVYVLSALGGVVLSLASAANADILSKSGNITKILVTADETFGGCMVKIDASFSSPCTNYASFDCIGQVMPKDQAARMWDTAQMASALGWPVAIKVDTNNTYNGHCVATRIDLNPPAP